MERCGACGTELPADADRCPACGVSTAPARTFFGLPSPLRAPSGGFDNDDPLGRTSPGAPVLPPAVESPSPADDAPSRTLFGVPSPVAPKAEEAEASRTLFGMPSPVPPDAAPGRTIQGGPAREPRLANASRAPDRQLGPSASPSAAVRAMPAPSAASGQPAPAAPVQPAQAAAPVQPAQAAAPAQPAQAAAPAQPAQAAAPAQPAQAAAPAQPTPAATPTETPADRDAAERYAAARIAAAVAEEQSRAARTRTRRALALLVLAGLVAAVAAALLIRERLAFRAELAGEVRVRRLDDRLEIAAGVRATEPADVVHPGGTSPIDGDATVTFAVPVADTRVGENPIPLRVRPRDGGDERLLTLNVVVYYRFVAPPMEPPHAGVPVAFVLEVFDGWTPAVEGATVLAAGPGRFRVEIDPGPQLAALTGTDATELDVPIRLTLTGPAGESRAFVESLRLPLPATPVVLLAPPHGWARALDRVRVRGRTVPGAEVRLGEVAVTADPAGEFELTTALDAEGPRTLALEVHARGHRVAQAEINVERLSPEQERLRKAEARARVRDFLAGAPPTPAYAALKSDATRGRRVRIVGEVLDVRRGDGGVDHVQVVTCRAAGGCLVWVEVPGVAVEPGDRVEMAGTLAGTRAYTTRAGESLTVPLVRAAVVVP